MTTKRLIGHTIKAEIALHLLLAWDRLPPAALACGVAAHLSYLRLLRPFPYVRLTSGAGLLSIGLLAASTLLWVRHFMGTFYTGAWAARAERRSAAESCTCRVSAACGAAKGIRRRTCRCRRCTCLLAQSWRKLSEPSAPSHPPCPARSGVHCRLPADHHGARPLCLLPGHQRRLHHAARGEAGRLGRGRWHAAGVLLCLQCPEQHGSSLLECLQLHMCARASLTLGLQAGGYPYSVPQASVGGGAPGRTTSGKPAAQQQKRRSMFLRVYDSFRWACCCRRVELVAPCRPSAQHAIPASSRSCSPPLQAQARRGAAGPGKTAAGCVAPAQREDMSGRRQQALDSVLVFPSSRIVILFSHG